MTRQISDRQVGIMLAMSIVSLKLLILPALISRYTIRYSYLTILCGFIIDFVFILISLKVLNKFPHLTFSEIIERSFGKVARYFINLVLCAYFFFKGILIIKETHNYFNETLFENMNWWFFVIPFLLLIFYVMIKDLKTISRSVEFFFILITAGVVLTILIPIKSVDFSNLLPLFGEGGGGLLKSLFYCNFSFGDYFVVIMVLGRVKVKPNSSKKIINYCLLFDFFVFMFYIVFVAMFGEISVKQSLAISDLPLHSIAASTISRLDWIVVIIWTITLVFQAAILFSLSCASLTEAFCFKSKHIPALIIVAATFVMIYHYYLNLEGILDLFISLPFSVVSLVVQVAVPVILLIGYAKLSHTYRFNAFDVIKRAQIKIQYTDISGAKVKKSRANKTYYF